MRRVGGCASTASGERADHDRFQRARPAVQGAAPRARRKRRPGQSAPGARPRDARRRAPGATHALGPIATRRPEPRPAQAEARLPGAFACERPRRVSVHGDTPLGQTTRRTARRTDHKSARSNGREEPHGRIERAQGRACGRSPSTSSTSAPGSSRQASASWRPLTTNVDSRNGASRVTLNRRSDGKSGCTQPGLGF